MGFALYFRELCFQTNWTEPDFPESGLRVDGNVGENVGDVGDVRFPRKRRPDRYCSGLWPQSREKPDHAALHRSVGFQVENRISSNLPILPR